MFDKKKDNENTTIVFDVDTEKKMEVSEEQKAQQVMEETLKETAQAASEMTQQTENTAKTESAETASKAQDTISQPAEKTKKEKKSKSKKKKKKKWIIWVILLLLVGGGFAYAKMSQSKVMPIPVQTQEAISGEITETVAASGNVESEETKIYFSKVTAPITSLNLKVGQGVKRGETLITFDTADIENSIKQAQLENQITKTGADATIAGINSAQSKAAEAAKNYEEAVQYVAHYEQCVAQYSEQLSVVEDLTAQQAQAQALIEKYEAMLMKNPEDKDATKGIKEQNKVLAKVEKQLEGIDVKGLKKNYEMCAGDLEAYKALKVQYEAQKESDPTAGLQKKQQSLVKESADLSKDLATDKLELAQQGVVAEFDGIVSAISVVDGQTVTEGMDLFTVCNADKVKVTIPISKYDIEKVKVGQKATVTINGNEYEGEVASISRMATVNQTGGVVVNTEVHVLDPDDNIVLGIEGKVKIETAQEKDTVLVPSSSVNYASDGVFCYIIEDGKAKKVDVEVGIADDEHIQIISGLKAGDKIILDVSAEIQEGVDVMEMPDEIMNPMAGESPAQEQE